MKNGKQQNGRSKNETHTFSHYMYRHCHRHRIIKCIFSLYWPLCTQANEKNKLCSSSIHPVSQSVKQLASHLTIRPYVTAIKNMISCVYARARMHATTT